MKPITLLFIAFLLLNACNQKTETTDVNTAEKQTEIPPKQQTPSPSNKQATSDTSNDNKTAPTEASNTSTEQNEKFKGYYVGMFEAEEYKKNRKPSYANKITVSIDSIGGNTLYGHSIVAGNMRPFEGGFKLNGNILGATGKEPGDDKYDGVFDFELNTEEKVLVGSWKSYDKNLAVTKRAYRLEKRDFAYNSQLELPEDVAWGVEMYDTYDKETRKAESPTLAVLDFNASTQLLKKEDIENMYQADLEIIRNAIYARHGYSFKNRRMRYVFDDYVDWYMPVKTNILADLTDLEKQNIELLKRYENHAEKYYDAFGR